MKASIFAALFACALLLGWYATQPGDTATTQPTAAITAPVATRAPLPATTARPPAPTTDQQPASLRGTQVDGRLETDYRGHLIVTDQLRHLFDYYFTTVGEISAEEAIQRISDHLAARLQQPARSQAQALLDAYVQYKTDLVELEASYPVIDDIEGLRARADAVDRLRAALFDPVAQAAFFAAEEVYDRFTLERMAIVRDESLSELQKGELIEDLRHNLPGDMQELLIPQIHQTLNSQTAELAASGADATQIRQLRMSLVGPQATQRLEALDAQREQWQQRVEQFTAERQAILDYRGLAEADKQAAIEALAQETFEPAERLRLAGSLGSQSGSL